MDRDERELAELLEEVALALSTTADPWLSFWPTFLAAFLATVAGAGAAFGAAVLLRRWDKEDHERSDRKQLELTHRDEMNDHVGRIILALSRLAVAIRSPSSTRLHEGTSPRDVVLHSIRVAQMIAKDDEYAALASLYDNVGSRKWPVGREADRAEQLVDTLLEWRRGALSSVETQRALRGLQ